MFWVVDNAAENNLPIDNVLDIVASYSLIVVVDDDVDDVDVGPEIGDVVLVDKIVRSTGTVDGKDVVDVVDAVGAVRGKETCSAGSIDCLKTFAQNSGALRALCIWELASHG